MLEEAEGNRATASRVNTSIRDFISELKVSQAVLVRLAVSE